MRDLLPLRTVGIVILCAIGLQGCGMLGANIPPEQMAKLATVEGASGYPLHSVDSKQILFTKSVNVEPGTHTFETIGGCFNNNCSYIPYQFNAKAGLLYRLMPNRTVVVLDRNDEYNRKLDELTPIGSGNEYANRQETSAYLQSVAIQAQQQRAALLERRRQNLPLVKRAGAKICKAQGEFLYIGFVESFTDEKVQIRVADSVINANHNYRNGNFTPSIIWDSPLNWDLCE